ncbi:ammonium transporter 1 member 3-like [Chanos chanos]|uniref:Ammonium transporter 1 member 3-like n=1 Tax=Chanos chanos TaxID=29144 RepID=A0A6J2W0S0_CHACN|nr:ammonium transporter 1 member 3-like [Chanos chanos]
MLSFSFPAPVVTFVAFWLHGYAFAFGEHSNFIGTQFFLSLDNTDLVHFFFNYVRCAVATTVALGTASERTEPVGYLMSAYVFSGFVYPVACHWVWDQQGIFNPQSTLYPSHDYAGSGMIFVLGGTAAVVSLRAIGPRAGHKKPHFKKRTGNPTMMAMGAFLQLLGFLGLVLGAHPRILAAEEGQFLGLYAINLLLAAASGGLYGLFFQRIYQNNYDLDSLVGGSIAGMVAVCAGVDSYIPGLAVMCGTTASFFFFAARVLISRMQVDDPLNVIPVYLVPGLWGLVYAGLLSDQGTIGGKNEVFGNNSLVALILFLWAVLIMHPLLSFFMCFGILRVPLYIEKRGKMNPHWAAQGQDEMQTEHFCDWTETPEV